MNTRKQNDKLNNRGQTQQEFAAELKTKLDQATPEQSGRLARRAFIDGIGAGILSKHYGGGLIAPEVLEAVGDFIEGIRLSVQPRDAIEEMLLIQMAWTHARMARISCYAAVEKNFKGLKSLNDVADAAANTYRRLMLALSDYRNPRRSFTAIKQANIAQQQVVQNQNPSQAQNENSETTTPTNEQGSPAPALLPHTRGIDLPEEVGSARAALAAEHRPQYRGGQG